MPIPENVESVIESAGWHETENPDVSALIDRAKGGHCMCCNAELDQNTLIVLDTEAVLLAVCGTACLQDFQVVHWLAEVYDDISTRVQFRGAAGEEGEDNPS